MSEEKIDRCPLCGSWRWDGRCGSSHSWGLGIGAAMSQQLERDGWRYLARCAEPLGDRATFDPWYDHDPTLTALAVSTCQLCPVKKECLEEGLEDEHGIWGGWHPSEREHLLLKLDNIRSQEGRGALLDRAARLGPRALDIPTPPKKRRG